jgi:hypothetical protein
MNTAQTAAMKWTKLKVSSQIVTLHAINNGDAVGKLRRHGNFSNPRLKKQNKL